MKQSQIDLRSANSLKSGSPRCLANPALSHRVIASYRCPSTACRLPLFQLLPASCRFHLLFIRALTRTISARVASSATQQSRPNNNSEHSLRVRPRRTRSKTRGAAFPLPLLFDPFVDPTLTPQSRVTVGSIRPNTASPNCFTAKTAMKKALTGMAR